MVEWRAEQAAFAADNDAGQPGVDHIVVSKRDERVVKAARPAPARDAAISAICVISAAEWLDVDGLADRARESRFMSL